LPDGETFYTVSRTEFDPISTDDNCEIGKVQNSFNHSATRENAELPTGTNTIVWMGTDIAGYLQCRCDLVRASGIEPFKIFVKTIRVHWSGIVAYFDRHVTNGVLKRINNKVQLAKLRTRGYRNIENFINMIYFLASKLKFNYPQYPS
jgi:hypothetical protein